MVFSQKVTFVYPSSVGQLKTRPRFMRKNGRKNH